MTLLEGKRPYDGVKVFSATTPHRREKLGDDVTAWLRAHPGRALVGAEVRQSSDARYHCVSIVIFWCLGRAA